MCFITGDGFSSPYYTGLLQENEELKGILPICAHCKKIRDDAGYWHPVEEYIRGHSEAQFSHGICPNCAREFYPE
jgi:hypothetical protein